MANKSGVVITAVSLAVVAVGAEIVAMRHAPPPMRPATAAATFTLRPAPAPRPVAVVPRPRPTAVLALAPAPAGKALALVNLPAPTKRAAAAHRPLTTAATAATGPSAQLVQGPVGLTRVTPWPTPAPAQPHWTAGASIQPIYEELYIRRGDQFGVLVAARDDELYRTNVAAIWTGGWVQVRFESYDVNGNVLGDYDWDTRWADYGDDGFAQFNRIGTAWCLAPRPLDSPLFNTKIFFRDGPGRITFYHTVIDNRTGDPVLEYAARYTADGSVWNGWGRFH